MEGGLPARFLGLPRAVLTCSDDIWRGTNYNELSKHLSGGELMSQGFFSRGFRGRRQPSDQSARIPPGQYLERGFPVLSAGPTQHTPLASWDFSIMGEVDQPKRWTWDEFHALP